MEDGAVCPLQSKHPLLAEGILKSHAEAKLSNPYKGEPDEDEMVNERLKRAKPVPHGFTDRAFTSTWGGFNFGMADRRQNIDRTQCSS